MQAWSTLTREGIIEGTYGFASDMGTFSKKIDRITFKKIIDMDKQNLEK